MSNDNTNLATPVSPLDESLERYDRALRELESAAQNKQNPFIEQIVEVLVARDVVEKRRVEAQNPSGASIAKLIELDSRLKEQRQAIATAQDNNFRENLSKSKESLNIPPTNWWWDLAKQEQEPQLKQAIKQYEQAIETLEGTSELNSELLLKVLLARDAIEQIRKEEKNTQPAEIDRIIELDTRLWQQETKEKASVKEEEQVDKWKVYYNPPPSHWWWHITTETPYFIQCVERYKNALKEVTNEPNPSPLQTLKLLKARDTLEKALKNQPSLPENISHEITELDQQLNQQRLALTRGNQLQKWKKSLNPPESNWWWNFKPSLFGEQEEPLLWRDRLWILGALVCIGIAAGFVVNTTQIFQSGSGKAQNQGEVRSDAAQNSLVILQGLGLLATGGTVVTKKGQKMLENLIISIPFLRPSWQAPTTFGLSLTALGVAYSINTSLPTLGNWYLNQGQKLEEENQFFQAQEKYLQASKLFTKSDDKAIISLKLGKVYEQQGNLKQAIQVYRSALTTDNDEVRNCLGRAIVLFELKQVGWTKLNDKMINNFQEAEDYFLVLEHKLNKGKVNIQNKNKSNENSQNKKNQNKNPQNKKNQNEPNSKYTEDKGSQTEDQDSQTLKKELLINQGIIALSKYKYEPKYNDLRDVENKFENAVKLEDDLPTTPDGRRSRCYLELTIALKRRSSEMNSNDINELHSCGKILRNSTIDINELSLISEYIKIIQNPE